MFERYATIWIEMKAIRRWAVPWENQRQYQDQVYKYIVDDPFASNLIFSFLLPGITNDLTKCLEGRQSYSCFYKKSRCGLELISITNWPSSISVSHSAFSSYVEHKLYPARPMFPMAGSEYRPNAINHKGRVSKLLCQIPIFWYLVTDYELPVLCANRNTRPGH